MTAKNISTLSNSISTYVTIVTDKRGFDVVTLLKIKHHEIAMFTETQIKINWLNHMTTNK